MTDLSSPKPVSVDPGLQPVLPDAAETADVVTLLLAVTDSSATALAAISKLFAPDGKQSRQAAHFLAIQVHTPDLQNLKAVLSTVSNMTVGAVCNGRFPGLPVFSFSDFRVALQREGNRSTAMLALLQRDGFQIAPEAQRDSVAAQHPNRVVVARTSESTLPTCWLLFDRDVDRHTPEWAASLPTDQWIAMLAEQMPGLDVAPRLETTSSSARVFRGGEPLGRGSGHVWVRVKPTDSEGLAQARGLVRDRLIAAGRAWSRPDKNGRPQVRLPVDQATWTSCSMAYCGKPEAAPGSGYEVRPATFAAVNEDGPPIDLANIKAPNHKALLVAQSELRPGGRFKLGRAGRIDIHDLAHDDLVDLEDGTSCELQDLIEELRGRQAQGDRKPRVRVQSPLRPESRSVAAFVALADNGDAFLCDSGLPGETHWISPDPAEVFERGEVPAVPLLDPNNPMNSARILIEHLFTSASTELLVRVNGEFYAHQGSCYAVIPVEEMASQIWKFLDGAYRVTKDGRQPFKPLPMHVKAVADALGALAFQPTLQVPCWLDGREHPKPQDVIALSNGLLDVRSERLIDHTPAFFSLNALPFAWDPEARAPQWEAFLKDVWAHDPEAILCLQEIFGYLIGADTSLQKIFMLVGPRRSGKGTVARILCALLGADNVSSPTMASLTQNFGMQQLIGKLLALVADARAPGRDQQILVERLLLISGEDSISIDRKNRDHWHGRLTSRVFISSNELIQLGDASNALVGRMVVLQMTRSFYGQEDPGLTDRLLEELPGIFVWALEGRRRLYKRGRFKMPASSEQAIADLEALNNPVGSFIEEVCVVGPECSVSKSALFSAWKFWCDGHNRPPGTMEIFAKQLRTALPEVRASRPRVGAGGREQVFEGIALSTGDKDFLHPLLE